MNECIHGFETGLCDICFPRPTPEPVGRPVRQVPGIRPRGSAPRSGPAGRPPQVPPFSGRRLYHWTHVRNLESVLIDDAVRAAAGGASPDVDVTAPLVRELRAHADVGDGRLVAEFVPMTLTPDSTRWAELRDGAAEAHWSTAARLSDPRDYLVLVVEARTIGDDVVVADGDAASPLTTFAIGEPGRAVARAARVDPELSAPEILVPNRVPLSAVSLIGVANEPMRQRVRELFVEAETRAPRVVVHTPWFTP